MVVDAIFKQIKKEKKKSLYKALSWSCFTAVMIQIQYPCISPEPESLKELSAMFTDILASHLDIL